MPGGLSVARSFGDIEAKLNKYGGNKSVLIAKPDIITFKMNRNNDFIVMACDGIFDRLSNREVTDLVWKTVHESDSKDLS